MISIDKINYRLVNLSLIFIIFFLSIKILPDIIPFLKNYSFNFVISLYISIILYSISKSFEKRLNSKLTKVLVIILFIGVIFLLIYLLVPKAYNLILNFKVIINRNVSNKFIKSYVFKISDNLLDFSTNILFKSIGIIKNIIEVIIFSIVLFLSMPFIISNLDKLFLRGKYNNIYLKMKNDFNKYFNTLIKLVLIEIVEYTFLFFIIHNPYYLVLGILMGITSLIPYLGNLIVSIFALFLSMSISFKLFIFTALIILIIPILDSYIRDPKIYKSSLKINGFKVILTTLILSYFLGIIGIIIAVPTIIVFDNLFYSYKYKI